MYIREMPKEDRPQEKLFFYGKESLSNRELLALVLRSGTKDKAALDLADELLSLDPAGLSYLATCSPEELKRIPGIGRARAAAVLSALELGRRQEASGYFGRVFAEDPDEAAAFFMRRLRHLKRERFEAALLDAGHRLMGVTEVATGDARSVIAAPAEIFREAVKRGAQAVIVAHNHPSGDPTPSEADLAATKKFAEAGELLSVTLFDHIIIGDGTFVSLREEGFIQT